MIAWHCDNCKKSTWMNPPSEQVFEDVTEMIQVPVKQVVKDKNGNESVKETIQDTPVTKKVPVMTKIRRQNPQTGKIEFVEVPKIRYQKPKTILVQMRIGDETIQKDFCEGCYKAMIAKKAESLWLFLEKIESN